MTTRSREKSLIVTVLASALTILGLGTEVFAQQIHACAKNNNGQLRLASAPGQCGNNETAITWNVAGTAGPQGPTGPAGPQGPPGSQGPAGASGVSGYEAVLKSTAENGEGFSQVRCPAGKVALGGGVWINEGGQFDDRILIGSHPYGEPFTGNMPPIGWTARAIHDGVYELDVWVICAFAN